MDIKFNKTPGEIIDVFTSLSIINNREADKKDLSETSFKRNEKLEKVVDSIIEAEKVNFYDFQLFFCEDVYTKDLFTFDDIWNYGSLNAYLDFFRNLETDELRKRLAHKINTELEKLVEKNYTLEEITKSNDSLLKYIRTKKINPAFKWEIYSILNHKDDYMQDFMDFMSDYLKVYEEIEVIRKPEIESFNAYIEEKLSRDGIEYLNQLTNNGINFKNYNTVHVTTSVFSGFLFSSSTKSNDCYIVIGSSMREGVKVVYGKDEVEKNLAVFKGVSDSTRFSIIKLLLNKDYFGLELAEAIGISNAAISHHLTSLMMSGVVTVEKGNHKCYYSLNKEKIKESITFLCNELELL
ncbi:hypothetical protein SDC9_96979 [bioreactor metagenome]|uniref:HTH arsR-type domain-containing protein n=1 Tax=bioreactor metagenome TaxID=1076179 RepID=A0A645AH99_9ZZZZ